MSLVKVFRVENARGEGPYLAMGLEQSTWASGPHLDSTGRPGPGADEGLKTWLKNQPVELNDIFCCTPLKPYSFGFKSLDQLFNWFDSNERLKLKQLGFDVVVYIVESKDVIEGTKQVIFKKPVEGMTVSIENNNNFAKNIAA